MQSKYFIWLDSLIRVVFDNSAPLTAKSRPNCCHQFAVLIERIHKQEAGQLFAFVGGFSTLVRS